MGPSDPSELIETLAELLETSAITSTLMLDFGNEGSYVVDCRDRPVKTVLGDKFESRPDCTVRGSFAKCKALFGGSQRQLISAIVAGQLTVEGDRQVLRQFGAALRRAFNPDAATPSSTVLDNVGITSHQKVHRAATVSGSEGAGGTASAGGEGGGRRWVRDSERRACAVCRSPFGLFNRRHHCRMCGDIFCASCSNNRWMPHNVRVCDACHRRINSINNIDNDVSATTTTTTEQAEHAVDDPSGDFTTPRRAASQSAAVGALAVAAAGGPGPLPLETPAGERFSTMSMDPAIRYAMGSEDTARGGHAPLLLSALETLIMTQQAEKVDAHTTVFSDHQRNRDLVELLATRPPALPKPTRWRMGGLSPGTVLALGALLGVVWTADLVHHPISTWPTQVVVTAGVWSSALSTMTLPPWVHVSQEVTRVETTFLDMLASLPSAVVVWMQSWWDIWTTGATMQERASAALESVCAWPTLTYAAVPHSMHEAMERWMTHVVGPVSACMHDTDLRWVAVTVVGVGVVVMVYVTRNLLVRRIRVYGTALRVFAALKYMKSTEHWRAHLSAEDNEAEWNKVHDRLAQMVLAEIVYLKGFWVKAGQYLSSRADILPGPWVAHLSQLQDELPAASVDELKETIEEELGHSCDSLFALFDSEPLGTASIAQVHRAVLRANGDEVVVKVQHRGINALMRQDLINMERIVSWVAYAEPDFDFKPIMNEWAKVAIDELDFKAEAANQKQVAANLARTNIGVKVPALTVLNGVELVSSKVIVMEYCHGFKVTDAEKMEEHRVDREALMRRICQAYAAQVYVDGLFNCDPHPGNILVSVSDGAATPVLLDFGMTKRLEPERRQAFASLVYSAASLDFGGLLQAFDLIGIKLKRDDPMEDMNNIRFILRDTAPPAESRRKFRAFREEKWKKRQMLPRSQRNPVEAWPADLLFFFRVTLLLRGLCAALEVRLRYMSVLKPYAHMALLRAYPLTDHAVVAIPPPAPGIGRSAKRSRLESRIREALHILYAQDEFVGVQVAAYHKGALVADVAAGTLGLADPRPVESSTLFNCFSVTKAITALAVHRLVDLGHVSYDDKVAEHWREFAAKGKDDVTVEHVLTHTAGLERAGVDSDLTMSELGNWEYMLHKMAEAEPSSPPGQVAKYHFLSFGWILGGVVRAVTQGRHLRDVVAEYIAEPLGLSDELYMGFADDDYPSERIATLINGFVEVEDGKIDTNSLNKLVERFQGLQGGRHHHGAASTPTRAPQRPTRVLTPDTAALDEVTKAAVTQATREAERAQQIADASDDAPLPPDLQAKMDQAVQLMLDHTSGAKSTQEWVEAGKEKGIVMWQHKVKPGSVVRGRGRINGTVHAISKVLENPTSKTRFDEKFISQRTVEHMNSKTAVLCEKFNGIWPVQGRDFCAIRYVHDLPDGTRVIAATDYPHPDCPPTSDSVRASVELTGYVLRPIGPNGEQTEVDYVAMSDLKGNVPSWIIKQVAKSQPLNIYRLGKVVEEDVACGRVLSTPLPPPPSSPRSPSRAAAAIARRINNIVSDDEEEGDDLVNHGDAAHDEGGGHQAAAAGEKPVSERVSVLVDPCIYNTPKIRKACIPSANGHFSARALAKVYAALASEGSLDGAELLSPATAAQVGVTRSSSALGLTGFSVEWGLGVRKFAFSSGDAVRKTAFGHGGMGGSIALCDPAEEFAIAITVNKLTLTSEVSTRLVDLVSTELGVGSFIRYGYEKSGGDRAGMF
eukprot:m.104335 g.104335  ORF g.104335 m.104335 type:complete len:1732 (-) comp10523_c0_seq1:284-5479(-)